MVRAELAAQVASHLGVNKKLASTVINIVFKNIGDALNNGDKVELRGFGSFTMRTRLPRQARNPKTGETVQVSAKKVPFFKPGKDLKIVD
ncbi:MAG: integration host factor subunit beta [Candidatus Schekmanbacteria bacterium]|nr:integration host factor subunit beta [Candidatus Schekmanbacteria bacterium]